jgi:hypothetical protein
LLRILLAAAITFWTRRGASAGAIALPWTSFAFEPATVGLLFVDRPPPACAVAVGRRASAARAASTATRGILEVLRT